MVDVRVRFGQVHHGNNQQSLQQPNKKRKTEERGGGEDYPPSGWEETFTPKMSKSQQHLWHIRTKTRPNEALLRHHVAQGGLHWCTLTHSWGQQKKSLWRTLVSASTQTPRAPSGRVWNHSFSAHTGALSVCKLFFHTQMFGWRRAAANVS